MLTREENELLTRVGPGTPMGNLFRRFWLPALIPSELPGPDCDPIRFRILGEDLVAFRDSTGKVGFVAQACPHRGASLFFGRNEESGLRCVYHGWKFDVEGNCVDMPNEPAESSFKHKVNLTAYPSAEMGGLIWIYLGPKQVQPPLPAYDWCQQPGAHEHSLVRKWMQDSSYSQGIEGDLDSAHVSFLHRTFNGGNRLTRYGAPRLTVRETDFGFVYGARRPADEGKHYWRVTAYITPFFIDIPGGGNGHFTLPLDDEHSWWFNIAPPPKPGEAPKLKPGQLTPGDADPATTPNVGYIPGTWKRLRNKENDYLIDREMQRTVNFTGMPGNRPQDQAMTESMGAIPDRTREHLGTTDAAIIFWRRYILKMARDLEKGIEPVLPHRPELFSATALNVISDEDDFDKLWEAHHSPTAA